MPWPWKLGYGSVKVTGNVTNAIERIQDILVSFSEIFNVEKYCDLEIWVKGHSWSLRVVSFHRLCIISYWCSLVTLSLKRTDFEIFDFKKSRGIKNRVRGPSMSLDMSPFDIAHMTSYWRSIVTMALSLVVSEIVGGTGISGLMRCLATLPKGGSRSLQWSETWTEDPQEDPLAVYCFCVCSGSALLGNLLGVSRSRERDLSVMSIYPTFFLLCIYCALSRFILLYVDERWLLWFSCQYLPAPCGLRGCKNGPTPFPGRMSYKATKPGLVFVLYLSMFYCVTVY